MSRFFLINIALLAAAPGVRGGETVVLFHVQPMAVPKPALKYQLLPELRELNPGNPVQYYLRCFCEQRQFFFSKEATEERNRYLSMPLAELRSRKVRQYGGTALRQADWAARLETPDWQLVQRVQTEGTDMQASELARLQILAAALQARFRIEVAGQHFDDAVRTAKTMLALARHLGDYPAATANLLGVIVAESAFGTLEEMVQQPACPNLYWALTDLPCPLVEVRKGFQGDCVRAATELREIREDAAMSNEQLQRFISSLSGKLGFAREQAGRAPWNLRAALTAIASDPERVQAGRDRLVEAGFSKELLQKLPTLQVVLLDEKREYETERDGAMKLLGLPLWEIDGLRVSREQKQRGEGIVADLLPQVLASRRAQAQLEQRTGLLRHIEALRLYAAEHGGPLPLHLSELPVPVPSDPFTGKPFDYKLDGGIAILRSSPTNSEEDCSSVRYELTVQK